ncbi:LysR family transcriptional regulator [Oceanobacillus sp. Castelsardo]|uniref:LysR family transcriptional regulator n=1 Tax=Oceanobacillus sp. Castelsardo TaxID=1851204 RepID=UPI000839392C|nr:LysR family transcriptional regulator [Oceanobacillus sp. Castelsardo]
MDQKDWEILSMIKKEGNISKAAKKLFMTQPAVTVRIRKMEIELNVNIVYRMNRGAQLTPQGEYLAEQAVDYLKQVEDIRSFLSNMKEPLVGTLKIGVSNFMTRYKIPQILQQFKEKHPMVNFNVVSGFSRDVFHMMQNQDVHVSFVRGDYAWQDQKHLLFEEPICVASTNKINLEDLPSTPRIEYKTDYKLKELIDTWWMENYRDAPYINMVVGQTDICREMLKKGLGYAILPKLVVYDIPNLYKVDLKDKYNVPIVRTSWMLYKKESFELNIVRAFVDFIKTIDFQEPI